MNSNLYTLFESGFPADRNACAIETHGTGQSRYYTWNDLDRGTAKMANLLASLKLPAGARVAAQVEKSVESLMLYLATIRAGYVYLPLNTAYRPPEVAHFLKDAAPAVVVCTPGNFGWIAQSAFQAGARHVFTLDINHEGMVSGSLLARAVHQADSFPTIQADGDWLAAILYTSGTTGRSKGAMLTHGNLASNARVLQAVWRWREGDVLLHALPLFHVHGLFVAANGALLNGSKMIFMPKFDSGEVLRRLSDATVFMGVPTYYVRLLDHPSLTRDACRSIRLFVSGSAPLRKETFDRFLDRTGHAILERYGMSETVMLTSNPHDGERRPDTVGFPLPSVQVRVASAVGDVCSEGEIGEVQVQGPNVFKGYWNMPENTGEAFTDDGWFRTGDLGSFDAQGYLSIQGRSKELIISGGYNVYPKEVESAINQIDGVAESAVIGLPHPDYGEAVVAAVVLSAGSEMTEHDIIAPLKARIANFKVPKAIRFIGELPRNAMGKVQKDKLPERFSDAF